MSEKITEKTKKIKYAAKGLGMLVMSLSLATTSIYAIYSGLRSGLSVWAADALLIAGAFTVTVAFVELTKLLTRSR